MSTKNTESTTPLNLLRKLHILRNEVSPRKNKTASITTTFSYKYVTLSSLWEQVCDKMSELSLYFGWYSDDSPYQASVLVTYIVDLDSGERLESRKQYLSYKTHTHKDTRDYKTKEVVGHVNTEGGDFRGEGAEYSYWKRMELITLLGLITNDDELAEESPWESRTGEAQPTAGKQTNNKKVVF